MDKNENDKRSWGGKEAPPCPPHRRVPTQTRPPPAMGDLLGVLREPTSHGYRATLPPVRWVSFSFSPDQRLLGSAWYGVWVNNWKAILIGSGVPYKPTDATTTRFLLRRQDDCALAIHVRTSVDASILVSSPSLAQATQASHVFILLLLLGDALPEYQTLPHGEVVRRGDERIVVDLAEELTPERARGWARFGVFVRGAYHSGPDMSLF